MFKECIHVYIYILLMTHRIYIYINNIVDKVVIQPSWTIRQRCVFSSMKIAKYNYLLLVAEIQYH